MLNEEPFQSAEMGLDMCDQGQLPVFMVEKRDEEIKLEKEPLSAENAYSEAIESNTDRKIVGNDDGGMRVDVESAISDERKLLEDKRFFLVPIVLHPCC
ncbi:hypothetical protein SOVF_198940 [Spinacia oleracea]|nr:hypothetical protein SOVF_198940 [Spinacia oleracea]